MTYIDTWKNKMKNNGGSITASIRKNADRMYALNFKENDSYRNSIILNSDLTENQIDIRVVNKDSNPNEKRLYLMPGMRVKVGSYIKYAESDDEYIYLVQSVENNLESPCCNATYCNQELVINKDISFPCITSNQAYGAKINVSSDFIPFPDVKLSIDVQENKITRKLPLGYRFIFDHSKSDIYKIIDKTMNITKGIIEITCEKDSCLQYDDLENNIAYQTIEGIDFENDNDIVVEYEIDGLKTIRVNRIEQYNINFSEKNGKFEIIDSSSENDYEVTSQTNENIKLKALNIGFVTIGYIINDKVVCQYDVMFER